MRRVVFGLYTYVMYFGISLLILPVMVVVALAYGTRDPGRRMRGRWMRRYGRWTSSLTPLWRFSWKGTPPADILTKAYVVVANHESTSDPFLLCSLPWDMRWISKEEIFKLPLLGQLMHCGGDIPLKRGSKDSILEMLAEARRTLDAGVPVMIFPEGTRSPDGNLLPFKDGAFRLAIEAQVPILPLALDGTRACRPKGSLWFGDADAVVEVLEPIPTTGLTLDDVPKLKEQVRERLVKALVELRRAHAPAVAAALQTA